MWMKSRKEYMAMLIEAQAEQLKLSQKVIAARDDDIAQLIAKCETLQTIQQQYIDRLASLKERQGSEEVAI